ncbi:hypothetical protein EBT11_07370 [bacterium]|nr:hypothetical protein [bacterium]
MKSIFFWIILLSFFNGNQSSLDHINCYDPTAYIRSSYTKRNSSIINKRQTQIHIVSIFLQFPITIKRYRFLPTGISTKFDKIARFHIYLNEVFRKSD